MTIISYIRRRVLGKASPLLKRVVLPALVLLVVMQAFTGRQKIEEAQPLSNLIVPGEAIDPIIEKTVGQPFHSDRHKEPVVPKPSPVQKLRDELHQMPPPSLDAGSLSNKDEKKDKSNNAHAEKNKMKSEKEQKQKKAPSPWSMATANITDSHKVRFKGHAITNQTVTLTLMSSSDKVFMSLNKREIYRNLGDRGIHIVVLNQHTGKVMSKRVFDTYGPGTEEEMVEFIDNIQNGRIIVFAVLDECSTSLTWRGRNKLKELGSRWSERIAYRDMWALVTRKGGLKLAETYSNVATADTGYEWGGPVFLRTDFDLEEKPSECSWPVNERNDARRLFCQRYEGYGAMCDCEVTEWEDVFFQADSQLHKQLSQKQLYKDIGVAILATNRSHYLFKTLKNLWEAPGFNPERVVVYTDKHYREIIGVTKLYGIPLVVSPAIGNRTSEIIRHKVQHIFRDLAGAKFPKETVPAGGLPEDEVPPFICNYVLLLEDDIQVSIDIFKYLHTLAPVLERDPSVLALSAFNYFGYRDVSNSLTSFYRTAEVNNIAILLPSRTIHEHLVPNWVETNSTREWYSALYKSLNKTVDGAIIYPEVPRARHFAYQGHTIAGGVQHNLFSDHILALTTDYDVPDNEVLTLVASQYDVKLLEALKKSQPTSFDFCKHDLLYEETNLVTFISYNGSSDAFRPWTHIMKCLGTWQIYPEAGWKGVWQFHYHGHLVSIVGTPFSPYSYLKPDNYQPMTAPPPTENTSPSTTSTTKASSDSSSSSASHSSQANDVKS